MSDKTERIAALNDAFRRGLLIGLAGGEVTGKYHITSGLQHALPADELLQVFQKVATFDHFTEDKDPHGEHDFGSLEHEGENIFWKIDYYDRESLAAGEEYGSEDPSDPDKTTRVMTIMLAQDY